MQSRERVFGFGLMEVMASLVIISIGILGIAGLYGRGLQYSYIADLNSKASILATDMMDRIKVNKEHAKTTVNYKVSSSDSVPSSCSNASYTKTCETGICTPQQLANYDINRWKFHLLCQLPNSSGSIDFKDSGSVRTYLITISFNKKRGGMKLNDFILRGSI